ncbi:hypothetical protein CGZ75_11730 [Paenibacillus herberti]|uniref:Uncharacterized protein n=1 Tax=Paenibacillus herberti TaxID=1619309 RepID=A0A229P5L1_9BACL|nr:hypothetical protein CGZ75_11730 [Paenibacillus herberti]
MSVLLPLSDGNDGRKDASWKMLPCFVHRIDICGMSDKGNFLDSWIVSKDESIKTSANEWDKRLTEANEGILVVNS